MLAEWLLDLTLNMERVATGSTAASREPNMKQSTKGSRGTREVRPTRNRTAAMASALMAVPTTAKSKMLQNYLKKLELKGIAYP